MREIKSVTEEKDEASIALASTPAVDLEIVDSGKLVIKLEFTINIPSQDQFAKLGNDIFSILHQRLSMPKPNFTVHAQHLGGDIFVTKI